MDNAPPTRDDLRVLLAVHRHGSFLAVGRALGLSTSTASRRIDALETALGRPLVHRSATGAHVWSKSFGSPGVGLCGGLGQRCNAVADANGSVVLSGALTGWVDSGGGPLGSMAAQTYAVKLDGGGAFLWQHPWPDHTTVKVDPCGAVVGAYDAGPYMTVDKLAP